MKACSLPASGVVRPVEPYYANLGKRIVKTPKLYFLDTGLACYLAGLRRPEELKHSTLLGPLFETHVLGQIVRHAANTGHQADVCSDGLLAPFLSEELLSS